MAHDHYCVIGTATAGLTLNAEIALSRDDRRRHLHLIGKTGTGKTTLLRTLIYDDLRQGRNLCVLDPLGGLAEAVAESVPPSRNDEAIYVDPSDLANPIGFNPLDRVRPDSRHLCADHILGAFSHIWGTSLESAPRMSYVLYNALRLLLDAEGTTLLGLPRLLVDDRYRAELLAQCRDDTVKAYWTQEFAGYDDHFRTQVIGPIQNKIGMLLAPPALRNMLGQPRSTINIARIMNDRGLLICNLAKGKIGATGSHLIGALIATTIAQVAEERASIPFEQRRDFTLYADEFQNFATDSFATIASEARNHALSLCVAHQFQAQVPEAVRVALLGNCGSLVAFRIGAEDAQTMAAELDIENHRILSDTPNFRAWARLLHQGNPTNAIMLQTVLPEAPANGRLAAVIAHTRARHTRSRDSVEALVLKQQGGGAPIQAAAPKPHRSLRRRS